MRVELGATFGRWVVLKYASPARRTGDAYLRPRVLVRCVCGTERVAYETDLKKGRTHGCRSARCRARYEASRELVALVRERVAELDQVVARFLRGDHG